MEHQFHMTDNIEWVRYAVYHQAQILNLEIN